MNETEFNQQMAKLEALHELAQHDVKMARYHAWIFVLAASAVLVVAVVSQMWLLLLAVAIMAVAVVLSVRSAIQANRLRWKLVADMRALDGV